MLLKFITKFMRPLGLVSIFLISILVIMWGLVAQDTRSTGVGVKMVEYAASFDNQFHDFRLRSSLDPNFISKDIVLVTIDDYSLEKIGSWPIPRTNHAAMIRKLKTFGAKVIGLDILFPEKAPVCGENNPDTDFAKAIEEFQESGNKIFMGYSLSDSPEDSYPEAPAELFDVMIDSKNVPGADLNPQYISQFTFPVQQLLDSKVGLGYLSVKEDNDGVFRHYPLVANVGDFYVGALGLNVYTAYSGEKPTLKVSQDVAEAIFNKNTLHLSRFGEYKIRYMGSTQNFPQVSLYDLIQADDQDKTFHDLIKGKMVFVGSTATGAHDLRLSPIDPKMPGVLAHMNMAEMLSQKHFYQSNGRSVGISLLILVMGMIVTLLLQRLNNAFYDVVGVIGTTVAVYLMDYYYFLPQGYELKLFYCLFCFNATYAWTTYMNFSETLREKKQIKGTFARYVAPTIVDEMLKDPEKLQVGGFKRDITCLFSDVRDFTSISEGLSATELAHSLNIYMGRMTDIVFDTRGTLDKYIGDAIVAFWGAPLEIGNHAQYAVEGAITMMNTLPFINEEFRKLGRPEFKIGIGLNSGECNVGNMGSARIFSYTALGDNMNLGARLESLCKHYGAHILISEFTLKRIDLTNIKVRPIDKAIVKGKTTAVAIYEVMHAWHPMTLDPEALNFYLTAWDAFQARNFKLAMAICDQILIGIEDDKPTKRLRDLCQKYVDDPSLVTDSFDITKMTEK